MERLQSMKAKIREIKSTRKKKERKKKEKSYEIKERKEKRKEGRKECAPNNQVAQSLRAVLD